MRNFLTGHISRKLRAERAQALVEFALVSVIFFMLIFGIFDTVRLFQSWVTVQHAAREGARFAVTGQVACTGFTDDRVACITLRAKEASIGLVGGGASGTDVAVSLKSWHYPNYSGAGTANSAGSQCDAVEVTVSYQHEMVTPIIKAILPGGIGVKGRQRMLNEPFGPCG